MASNDSNGAHIISDLGADMMTLESIGREGDRMTVQGALMGAWSTTMYVGPEDAWKLVRMILKPAVLGYMLSLPLILWRQRRIQRAQMAG